MKHTLKIVNNMSKSVLSMGNGFIDRQYLWEEKVGYDSANKKMIARVYEALRDVVEGKSDEGRKLVKGSNWDRFYSDEDWSWFITDTASWGQAKIVK